MRQPLYRFLFLILSILGYAGLQAQDPQFSQYNYTPTLINPALAGSFSNAQVIFNYRSQWKSPEQKFTTPLLTAIVPFSNKATLRKGGVGFSAISDKTGGSYYFQNTGLGLTVAYNFYLNRITTLAFGAGLGYFQRRLSDDGLTTGSQYVTNSGYNASLPLGEDLSSLSKSYLDLNTGLVLSQTDTIHERRKYYLGISGFHLSQPNLSFSGVEDKLPLKLVGCAGYMILSRQKVAVTPEILYVRQNNLQRILGGVHLSYYFQEKDNKLFRNTSIDIIPRYSSSNAVIIALQINKDFFSLGFSYDVNIGGLSEFNGYRGASEIMIALRLPSKKKSKVQETDYSIGQVREFITKTEKREDSKENNPNEDHTKGYQFHLQETILFEFNDTTLNDKAKQQLTDIANLLKGNQFLKIKVTGHSDKWGTEKANRIIADARAKVSAEFLIENGIDKSRITIEGKGSQVPAAPNSTEEGRAKNRRVEFEIYK